MNKKKRVVKRQSDNRKITISIPEEVYFQVKHFAKDEIRTISQQARLFLEIGLQVVTQPDQSHDANEPEEKESCIGFQIERSEEDDD